MPVVVKKPATAGVAVNKKAAAAGFAVKKKPASVGVAVAGLRRTIKRRDDFMLETIAGLVRSQNQIKTDVAFMNMRITCHDELWGIDTSGSPPAVRKDPGTRLEEGE